MNSCLYNCEVMHYRLRPKKHKFTHKVFMFYLDLDEIDELAENLWLVSRERSNVYNFTGKDHMDYGGLDPKENVRAYLKYKNVDLPVHKIKLLTNLRTFGYNFNPVSFYFCFDRHDEPLCVIPEIGNTFGEIKAYFLGQETRQDGRFVLRQTKYYYISPFVDLDIPMEFNLKVPEEGLDLRIDDYQDDKKLIVTSLTGRKVELNNRNLLWYSIRFPLITLKVIGLIHWHALILYFKKIPYHMKESNPQLQREVNRVIHKH